MNSIFIKPDVLNWKARVEHGTYEDQLDWDKPYQYLDLAYDILRLHQRDIGRIDILANLKRAIDHRIKRISKLYSFKMMNSFGFSKEYLERLEQLGLVKPLMIDAIYNIRNQIEHHYFDPPDKQRCAELADFVWYFLKATDSYVRYLVEGVILEFDYQPGYMPVYWVLMKFAYPYNWKKVSIRGWLHPDDLTPSPSNGVEVCVDRVLAKSDTERPIVEEAAELWDYLDDKAISFSGVITLDKTNGQDILKAIFKADRHM